jgi:hypothetical protein
MMGFTWVKEPADETWHVPIQGENFKTVYLCRKAPTFNSGGDVERAGIVFDMTQIPGKVCENCVLEEIVIEMAI